MSSLDSKLDELIDFYKRFRDFKDFEILNDDDDAKKRKNKVMNTTDQLYNKYFNTYKEEYDSEDLNEEDFFDPNQYKILGKKKQKLLSDEDKSGIKQPTQLKQLNLNKISKPLWIEVSKKI